MNYFSQILSYWYRPVPSTDLSLLYSTEQSKDENFLQKNNNKLFPGPARNLPPHLTLRKLNPITVPVESLVVNRDQLKKVNLKKSKVKPAKRFYIHRNLVIIEFQAAAMIRLSRGYKKSTSANICKGITELFQERDVISVKEK